MGSGREGNAEKKRKKASQIFIKSIAVTSERWWAAVGCVWGWPSKGTQGPSQLFTTSTPTMCSWLPVRTIPCASGGPRPRVKHDFCFTCSARTEPVHIPTGCHPVVFLKKKIGPRFWINLCRKVPSCHDSTIRPYGHLHGLRPPGTDPVFGLLGWTCYCKQT